jgi:hypothetical protein
LTLELHRRIRDILFALPVLEERRATIEDEANRMWDDLFYGDASPFLPDTTPMRTSRSAKDLLALIDRLVELGRHMSAMKVDRGFLDALEKEVRRDTFAGELVRVETAARHELERLRSQPEVTGPPRKLRAQAVTMVAIEVFERLTGKEATLSINSNTGAASGPFLDCLKAVFEACGIDASAEAQAKAARRKLRSKGRP